MGAQLSFLPVSVVTIALVATSVALFVARSRSDSGRSSKRNRNDWPDGES